MYLKLNHTEHNRNTNSVWEQNHQILRNKLYGFIGFGGGISHAKVDRTDDRAFFFLSILGHNLSNLDSHFYVNLNQVPKQHLVDLVEEPPNITTSSPSITSLNFPTPGSKTLEKSATTVLISASQNSAEIAMETSFNLPGILLTRTRLSH